MKSKSKSIGIETIKLVDQLPQKAASWVLSKQILRSSTSIGANYRAAYRAKSTADFIYKLKIVEEEEADETIYWPEVLQESGLLSPSHCQQPMCEISQVLSIVVTSINTARKGYKNHASNL